MTYFLRVCVIIFMLHFIPHGNSFHFDGLLNGDKPNKINSDEPLYLTPYISKGRIIEARNLSRVNLPNDTSKIKSYSGLITVNKTDNGNIFFWFVPATECCNKDAPVLIWLQGGPGASGLFGFFALHGPYFIYPNMTIGLREHAWTKKFNVIYVDNPVGTGFSFTNSADGYSRNEEQVAENLYKFLQQFFTMFSEYRTNDFYVTGESYAGKYVPALSYKIHVERRNSEINFKGMAMGNAWSDPETIMDYAPYFYQLGLVDRMQANIIQTQTDEIVQNIRDKNYLRAFDIFEKMLEVIGPPTNNSYMRNFTGFSYYYNFIFDKEPADINYYQTYAVKPEVRKAIHVGNLTLHGDAEVVHYLSEDIMQSVKPQVKVILDSNYKVMYYSGQLDLSVPYPMTVNFLQNLDWKDAEKYKKAQRIIWRLKDDRDYIAGYAHQVNNFCDVMVRNVGHFVPHDYSKMALELITRFIFDISFGD